jgi:hypothetical protein
LRDDCQRIRRGSYHREVIPGQHVRSCGPGLLSLTTPPRTILRAMQQDTFRVTARHVATGRIVAKQHVIVARLESIGRSTREAHLMCLNKHSRFSKIII